jgi:hypothetical protein
MREPPKALGPIGGFAGGALVWASQQFHWEWPLGVVILVAVFGGVCFVWTIVMIVEWFWHLWNDHREKHGKERVIANLSYILIGLCSAGATLLIAAAIVYFTVGSSVSNVATAKPAPEPTKDQKDQITAPYRTEIESLKQQIASQNHPQPQPAPVVPAKTYYPREAENAVLALQRLKTAIRTDIYDPITRSSLPNFEQSLRYGVRMSPPLGPPGQPPPANWRQERWNGVLTSQMNTITQIQDAINSGTAKVYQLTRSDDYADQKEILDPFIQQIGVSNKFFQAMRDYIYALHIFVQNGWEPTWEIFRPHDTAFTTAFREYVNQLQTTTNAIDVQIKEVREHTR